MGLDTVELIMDVEDAFGVKIPDADAAEMRTVGQLWEYLSERVEFDREGPCASAAAFYRLRRGLVAATNLEKSAFRPATRLDSLISNFDRRRVWREIRAHTSLELPELQLGPALRTVRLGVAIWLAALIVVNCISEFSALANALLGFAVFVATFIAVGWLLTPFKHSLEPAWNTVGGLGTYALGLNEEYWKGDGRRSREAMWEKLRVLIATQLGVPYEEVTPSARFVEDFGAD